jgi:rhamnose utilization protein RhaD (predicted bifunctional aldolase and dehydrogenase)/NAD(P)-dependent dehydrogenase (short-subunit alcohol dehydrogenase family)
MDKQIKNLIEVSQQFGRNKKQVIAGGGNTSFKNDDFLWVKASGRPLASIDETGFVKLYRHKLKIISERAYSDNSPERELQIKTDLYAAIAEGQEGRPSVETSLHEIIPFKYVVHVHPTLVNGLLCSKNSADAIKNLFGNSALYIEYTEPGYVLFKKTSERISQYITNYNCAPQLIFLENHGIFYCADTVEEIIKLSEETEKTIETYLKCNLPCADKPIDKKAGFILPAIRMMFTNNHPVIARIRHNELIAHFYTDKKAFSLIQSPFTPDIIVYCKSKYLYIDVTGNIDTVIDNIQTQVSRFRNENGFSPKIILIKDIGLIAIDNNWLSAETALDVFEDLMKISYYTMNSGGPRFLTGEQIEFIDNWEAENYRRQISVGNKSESNLNQKIIVITGAAQGFGEGIARTLMGKQANIVIADINAEKGQMLAEELNDPSLKNHAVFIKTDVSDADSVKNLFFETVKAFGGLDVLISNAGVLRAGDLDEMEPSTFELITKINYNGYFLCVKYASMIFKIQAKFHNNYYTDIIQINSKSGLRGSNKNFAYAGSKFGGIGLTQSFALELIPYRIKVNAICPGNFFDGPLWSDPVNGLFVQYLKTGKVPGAKTIDDVKKYYELQVPMGRGCNIDDVMKAVYYLIDQQYETGQALPVTGGQEMLK